MYISLLFVFTVIYSKWMSEIEQLQKEDVLRFYGFVESAIDSAF